MKKTRIRFLALLLIAMVILSIPAFATQSTGGLPVVTKNPSGERVDLNGQCWFIAYAQNYTSMYWWMEKDGETVLASEAAERFPKLVVTGATGTTLGLNHIQADMNGWQIGATFVNANGKTDTATCELSVRGGTGDSIQIVTTPTPDITIVTTPSPDIQIVTTPAPQIEVVVTPSPTPRPTATPLPTATPTPEVVAAPARASVGTTVILSLVAIVVAAAIGGGVYYFASRRSRRARRRRSYRR